MFLFYLNRLSLLRSITILLKLQVFFFPIAYIFLNTFISIGGPVGKLPGYFFLLDFIFLNSAFPVLLCVFFR